MVHTDSTCDAFDLASYLEGALDPLQVERVESHLLACEVCRSVVASWHLPDDEPRPPLVAGTRLDHYMLLDPLGAGGMGVVFRARDEALDREVAIKVLGPAWFSRTGRTAAAAVQDLREEARALAQLRHRNIVRVYGVGEVAGRPYLAMERLKGPTLRHWHEQRHSRRRVARVWAAVARGLMAAHAVGIVHRDFKPDNVIVDEDGEPRLLDFGLAIPAHGRASSLPVGTARYAAPEQLAGGPVDAKADQFSFCTALHEAMFGHHPSQPSTRRWPPLPSRLRNVIRAGLRRDPQKRHATMQPIIDALEAVSSRRRLVGAVSVASFTVSMVALANQSSSPGDDVELGLDLFVADTDHAAWISRWERARTDACLDSHVRSATDMSTYRRRLSCLDDLAGQFEAHVVHGPWSVSDVADPKSCLRPSHTVDGDDPVLAERLDAVRTLYERLEFDALDADGRALARDAERAGHPEVAATALKFVAAGDQWNGDVDRAEDSLRAAQLLAREAGADVLQATLWVSRAGLEGLHRERPGVALGMLEVAESLLARADATSSVHMFNLLETRGSILGEHGRRPEAASALEAAWRLIERIEGPQSARIPTVIARLAAVWADPGDGQDLDHAQSLLHEALRILSGREDVDDGYDDVARLQVLNQLAGLAHQRGRFAEAIESMEKALALAPAISEDPLDLALLRTNLALSMAEVPDRAADAERVAREAIEIFRERRGDDSYLLTTPRLALAHALIQLQRCDEALEVLADVVSVLPTDPSDADRQRASELGALCEGQGHPPLKAPATGSRPPD